MAIASQPSKLMDSLKEAIREQHARMEALPLISALTTGHLSLESYVGQLRAMAVIHGTLEHEMAQGKADGVRTLMLGRPSRLAHLRQDLSFFDSLHIPDIEAAVEHSRNIAERIRRYRVEQPTALLGVLYVLEGMTLGNAVHLPDVLKIFGKQTKDTAHYYRGYGDRTDEYWREFCAMMNVFPLETADQSGIIDAALGFFDLLEPLFKALYPLENANMVMTAGMLNPEAGDHAVPQRVEELEATAAAARRCREEFPYFDERYQERGRSFARSDTAWLATLAGLPATQLLSQVDWLGRVLANRGMPRITLERQLELLYEELCRALPEYSEHYRGLLEAAANLRNERLRTIPEPVFRRLAKQFRKATEDELEGRFSRTGELIIAAVCDQQAGMTDAVSSLLPWLQDRERFSPEWIAAVSETLDSARASATDQAD